MNARMMRWGGLVVLPALGIVGLAQAHHSDAVYDRNRVVAFEAEVVRYAFRNPHVMIMVETTDQSGRTVEWEIETGSTNIMRRSGWTPDLLSPGDVVTVRAHPLRNGRPEAILNTLETADGRLWYQVEEDVEATAQATNIAGVWKGISTASLNPQARQAALTPAARAAMEAYDPVRDAPSSRCIATPPPFQNSSGNYLTGIEILDDRVIIRNEFIDVERVIYTDGREHPQSMEPTNQGHSIGWWEDDVLVVDTRFLAEHRSGNGPGIPSSTQKHVIERFSLSEDGTRAIVDVVVEDPEYLAEPFQGRTEMTYVPHLQLYRYNCSVD